MGYIEEDTERANQTDEETPEQATAVGIYLVKFSTGASVVVYTFVVFV